MPGRGLEVLSGGYPREDTSHHFSEPKTFIFAENLYFCREPKPDRERLCKSNLVSTVGAKGCSLPRGAAGSPETQPNPKQWSLKAGAGKAPHESAEFGPGRVPYGSSEAEALQERS